MQIYTGRWRRLEERETPVELIDDYLKDLEVGCFVAMFFENSDEIPCIGKVLELEEEHFTVHYYKGTYGGKWTPRHVPRKKHVPWNERLPKSCIVCCNFTMENDRLEIAFRKFLKERYDYLLSQEKFH